MKTYNLLCFFLLTSISSMIAQVGAPNWSQESVRNSEFPDATYLKGYFYAENNTNEPSNEFINKQIEAAQAQLIGSIYSKLSSISEMDLTNTTSNSEVTTEEIYRLRSASVSNANISGLRKKQQYDANTKIAYAFVYAKKSDVISYNKTLLEQNRQILEDKIKQAQKFETEGENQLALKTYYECMIFFREVETAESVLLALTEDTNFPNRKYYNDARAIVDKAILNIQKSDQLSLDDVCLFMAKGLRFQTEDLREYIQLFPFTLEDKGFSSEFSEQFLARFENQLTQEAKYKVGRGVPSFSANSAYVLKGSYWEEGDIIKIIANLKDNKGNNIASAEGQLPKKWILANNIEIRPEMLDRLALLEDLKFVAENRNIETKISDLDKNPAKVIITQSSTGKPLNNVPVIYEWTAKKKALAKSSSNRNGLAAGVLNDLPADKYPHRVKAYIDLPRFLGLDASSVEYQKIAPTLPNPADTYFSVQVNGQTVFLEGEELDHNRQALPTAVLAPTIKSILTDEGYTFVEAAIDADVIVSIKANIDEMKSPGSFNFAYLSCEVSIFRVEDRGEIYGNTFARIKGGGGSPAQATTNAYKEAADRVAKGIRSALRK